MRKNYCILHWQTNMKILLKKYGLALKARNKTLACLIEHDIIEKTRNWSFYNRDKIIEQLTLLSI